MCKFSRLYCQHSWTLNPSNYDDNVDHDWKLPLRPKRHTHITKYIVYFISVQFVTISNNDKKKHTDDDIYIRQKHKMLQKHAIEANLSKIQITKTHFAKIMKGTTQFDKIQRTTINFAKTNNKMSNSSNAHWEALYNQKCNS